MAHNGGMKKRLLFLLLPLTLIGCSSSPRSGSLTLDQTNPVSFSDGSGHFSDKDAHTYTISKGTSDGEWFTLSQGGYLTNDAAYPHLNYTSITVDYLLKSDYGYLTAKASQYAISSPENGASEVSGSTSFTFEGETNQYFSLYAPIGTFEIKAITLTYDSQVHLSEEPASLDFYSINDTHGAVEASATNKPQQVGIEKLSGYLHAQQKSAPEGSIVLSSGDMWQGSATSNLTHGEVMVDWMNVVGFESMAIGNHEFDWTPSRIEENSKRANFPFLSINLLNPQRERPTWALPSKIVRRGNWKIGVIGAIGNLASSIAVSSLSSYSFRDDYPALIHDEAERLRNEEGCALVVVSIHNGSLDTTYCHNIDAVFEGHSHKNYDTVDSYGIPHVQCSANGSMLQKVSFKNTNGKLSYQSSVPLGYSLLTTSSEDSLALGVYGYYEGKIGAIKNEVVGHTSSSLSQSMLVNLAAQVSCEYYANKWDSEVVASFLNTGSARQGIAAGDITYGEVYQSFPFDNDNIIFKIKGSALLSFLNDTYLTSYSLLEQSAIESEKIYKAMVISYVSEQAGYAPYLTEVTRDSVVRIRDIVADYFRNN
jgi:5'-nucleotidase/UDP-sugar diphosphatase